MKINHEKDVREFHEKFGPFTIEQQQSLAEEECKELAIAILQGDRVAIARECVDVIYAVGGWSVAADSPIEFVTPNVERGEPHILVMRLMEGIEEWIYAGWAAGAQLVHDVASKAALVYSIPLPEVWAKVHAANMRKEKRLMHDTCNCLGFDHEGNGDHELDCAIRQPVSDKPTKPPGWVGPDVAGVLGAGRRCRHCGGPTKHRLGSSCQPCGVAYNAGFESGQADIIMHPNGRCECCGEGKCVWCKNNSHKTGDQDE